MAKYRLNQKELLEHWNDQLGFIQSSNHVVTILKI
jgi:hypothetical protein